VSDQNKTNSNNNEDLIYINDESSLHHFRTEIPNIIYELGLSGDEFFVYSIMKKSAGDKGKCTKSNKTICQLAKISKPYLIRIKKKLSSVFELIKKPLIKITKSTSHYGDSDPDIITIIDIWPDNFNFKGGGNPELPPSNPELPGGVVNGVYQVVNARGGGGKRRLPKQEPTKKNPSCLTTPTPSKGESLVVVISEEDKAIAKKIRDFVDSKGNGLSEDWKISISKLEKLSAIYGNIYLDEQFKYTYKRQKSYISNLGKMHPDPKCKPIDKPYVYLKRACENNWAESENKKG